MKITCIRPIPQTGPVPTWWRQGRDAERKLDAARCLCGHFNCRDAELLDIPNRQAA